VLAIRYNNSHNTLLFDIDRYRLDRKTVVVDVSNLTRIRDRKHVRNPKHQLRKTNSALEPAYFIVATQQCVLPLETIIIWDIASRNQNLDRPQIWKKWQRYTGHFAILESAYLISYRQSIVTSSISYTVSSKSYSKYASNLSWNLRVCVWSHWKCVILDRFQNISSHCERSSRQMSSRCLADNFAAGSCWSKSKS